jgi:dTDP-3-amino-2,3,6-trideoxy-4-keto-D-glucose/dTDP-3-amino-3,4,6-trideoxy-alpha-D-glucose/dTDP-2,6-dideoxy-D-kanosamine transaminase
MQQINSLSARIAEHQTQIKTAIDRVLASGWLVLGREVKQLEQSFAAYIGASHCVGVANGTDAIELALKAMGIVPGDRVATVANAGMYTSTALLAIGATPEFMDIDLETQLVAQDEVERVLQQGVKAVVVTHLYGRAQLKIADIAAKCHKANIVLVEDCAQAHGACVNGKPVGSFGDAGCFSFYPTKNLGALGDGGAVVCHKAEVAEKVIRLRQYGWSSKYQVELAGARNSRLDEVQAAILTVLLPYLDSWNARRREIASQYSTLITHPEVKCPPVSGAEYVAHLYVVRSPRRDVLCDYLRKQEIATDVHYPIPDYRQPVFGVRFAGIHLHNTERLAQEILTLPCYPEMTSGDVQRVINAVNEWPISHRKGDIDVYT